MTSMPNFDLKEERNCVTCHCFAEWTFGRCLPCAQARSKATPPSTPWGRRPGRCTAGLAFPVKGGCMAASCGEGALSFKARSPPTAALFRERAGFGHAPGLGEPHTPSERGIVISQASSAHDVTSANHAAFGASSFPGAIARTSVFWMRDTQRL